MTTLLLRQVPLFASLSDAALAELSKLLRPREIAPGSILCREGDPGDRLYIILDGQVQIVKQLDDGLERVLNLKGSGDFIGEMSLFDRKGLRTASARALTPLTVLEMTHLALDELLHTQPDLAYHVVRELSLRLRDADNTIIQDLQQKNRQLEQALLNLKAAQAQIIEKEKLDHELQLAERIQKSILPAALPCLAGFDFGARIQPAHAVGGDFFDMIPLSSDEVAVAIGDVSGKGVPAAIFMALTRSLLRAEAHPHSPPGEVLWRVNEHLLGMNEAGMFATLLYGVLGSLNCRFTYARAGHEVPWVFDSSGNLRPTPKDRGQPLGILSSPHLDEQSLALFPGDTLLLYTDGLPDAQDVHMQRLGYTGLKEMVSTNLQPIAQATCDAIVAALCDYQGAALQNDDIALLTIQTNP